MASKEKKMEATPEEQLKEMEAIVEKQEAKKDAKVSKEFDEAAKVEEGRTFKRESREERFAREAQDKLDNWVPKTEMGRMVRAGKIKTID